MSDPLHDCMHDGCSTKAMTDDQFVAHQLGHRIDDRVDAAKTELAEGFGAQIADVRNQIDALPGALGRHFHAAIDDLDPKHTHLTDIVEHAEEGDCELCTQFKTEYDAKVTAAARATFETEQAEAEAARVAEAEAAKQAEPAKPTPVKPRVFGNDLDLFSVGAHDLAYDEVADNKYIVYVKPGEEDEEFPRQTIERGVLPTNCVIRTGEDGRRYICDPEPAPPK